MIVWANTHLFRQAEKGVAEEHVSGLAPRSVDDDDVVHRGRGLLLHVLQALRIQARVQNQRTGVATHRSQLRVPVTQPGDETM